MEKVFKTKCSFIFKLPKRLWVTCWRRWSFVDREPPRAQPPCLTLLALRPWKHERESKWRSSGSPGTKSTAELATPLCLRPWDVPSSLWGQSQTASLPGAFPAEISSTHSEAPLTPRGQPGNLDSVLGEAECGKQSELSNVDGHFNFTHFFHSWERRNSPGTEAFLSKPGCVAPM